ncbi:unnamed protein product [Leptidea sinapis]|uniref:Uncharacterized protein n=1 Tax=Leptidea sinapis TaxID=189913 RepID=A0A5E4QKC5_9NEOP|nr:unnamed protein product [Leptidea sinapis]
MELFQSAPLVQTGVAMAVGGSAVPGAASMSQAEAASLVRPASAPARASLSASHVLLVANPIPTIHI